MPIKHKNAARKRSPVFQKNARGRYTIEATERALKLKSKNPAAWRKLPPQLRSEAEEAEGFSILGETVHLTVDPKFHDERIRFADPFSKIHPRLRALAKIDKQIGKLALPWFYESEALLPYITVPGQRGRPADVWHLLQRLADQGMSKSEMARVVFPKEEHKSAYSKVRSYFSRYRHHPSPRNKIQI